MWWMVDLWLCLGCALLQPGRANPQNYPIIWEDVALNPPDGKNLTSSCTCNLHPFVCDRKCCCDPDCPQALSDATRRSGECRPEGFPEQTLDFCVPDGFVKKVNLPTGDDFFVLKKQAADDNFFGQLLCIKKSSNPKLSDEYPDPPVGAVDGNPSLVPCPSTATEPTIPSTYQAHTPIFIARNGVRQQLALPAPIFSAICVDQAVVGFLDNIPRGKHLAEDVYRSCMRAIPDESTLERFCEAGGVLAPERYRNFTYARTPSGDANVSPSLPYALISNNGSITTADPETVTSDFANGVCSNSVQHINVTVYYSLADSNSVEATIEQVSVGLTLTDVAASAGAHRQFVRVVFVDAAQQVDVLQPFSGNPGYLRGLPLLGGRLTEDPNSDKIAVQRFVRGITAPQGSETDGTCSAGAQGDSVRFGANSTTNCAIELTRAQLESFCNSGNPQRYLEDAMRDVYTAIVTEEARVGIWGNSDPDNVNEWLQVRVSNFPFNEMSFSASPASCSNVVVGYDLKVLTGVAFASNNLQRKVLYVHLCFRTDTWTFPATKSASEPHRFYLTSTATFVPKDQEKRTNVKKPSPPLRTNVPEDIFYPFVTSSAAQLRLCSKAAVGSLAAFLTMLVLL
ncbi:hypothetical protein DUNSADRAFT_7906 [Dunaliella salina]|uniref:Tectonic-1-3 N-terminal domain-containing protein n=1 Tax=Dunaliella salina TaxID=3046 RepID=A0ABQ7GKF6_DUNSA|nr:hypothetical protein DUNSADRAFT_7906 [Dunaliella salina]|eukprot:KAF5835100.1 hypothetical protein DUNSADRAFT_7906 [Dunaliella salina]